MKRLAALLTLTLALAISSIAAQAATYTSYYAFGDSLTDDGKLGLPLPYAGGRFSTGPVWAEFIAERFTTNGLNTANFALGGATAGDTNLNVYPAPAVPFSTFNNQITTFTPLGLSPLTGDNPLISVLFGANDLFQGGNPIDAANAMADGIQRLANLAPKFDDFLVSTLPFIPQDPTGAFNAQLETRLQGIEASGINIIRLDQALFTAGLFPQLGALGVTNLSSPCLVAPTATTPGFDCTIVGFNPDGTPIRDLSIADTYYLIDDVHPTGPIQKAFGEFAINALGNNIPPAVPLPAGGVLLMSGVALLALRRRRQAA